jgi:ketosteroid isomerase-like protein
MAPDPVQPLRAGADALIAACNAFDVARVQALFAVDAVIDDPSTGHRFDGHAGVRDYVERYFIVYHTTTRFLSITRLGENNARVRVDFTGDFGHEIGVLDIRLDAAGLIARIDADLE